jgi:hypothetical protein
LNEVTERDKDIRYSSRTRAGTDTLRQLHDLRHSINMLIISKEKPAGVNRRAWRHKTFNLSSNPFSGRA